MRHLHWPRSEVRGPNPETRCIAMAEWTDTELLELYERVLLIRLFEERVAKDFRDGKIPGITHLYLGQEAVAAGVSHALRPSDMIISNHRGHGHMLAKGAPPNEMMAEIWGRATGLCGGKGGSMHLSHPVSGCIGTNGIVGGGMPMSAGVGLAMKQRGLGEVAVVYVGDGTISTGAFHEGAVLISLESLPVLIVAENNRYSETTGTRYHLRGESILTRLGGYGFSSAHVDGMDAIAVADAAAKLLNGVRQGRGPAVLEADTYRYHGHYEGEFASYRQPEEIEEAKRRDPVAGLRQFLRQRGLTDSQLSASEAAIRERVEDAASFAAGSPFPDEGELLQGVTV